MKIRDHVQPLLLLIICLMLPTSAAFAAGNVMFMPAFIYLSETEKQDKSKSEDTALYVNTNLGLLLNGEIGLAAKYFARISNFKLQAGEDGTSQKGSNDLSSLGLGLFYDSKSGPYFGAYYLHDPQKKQGNGSDRISYEGGYGYFVEAAYKIKAGSMELGPMITYANLIYTKRETAQTTEKLTGTWADSLILPFFGFWFYF